MSFIWGGGESGDGLRAGLCCHGSPRPLAGTFLQQEAEVACGEVACGDTWMRLGHRLMRKQKPAGFHLHKSPLPTARPLAPVPSRWTPRGLQPRVECGARGVGTGEMGGRRGSLESFFTEETACLPCAHRAATEYSCRFVGKLWLIELLIKFKRSH